MSETDEVKQKNDDEKNLKEIKDVPENEQLSDYVKDLIKPENLIGPFNSTEEMIKKLLEDDEVMGPYFSVEELMKNTWESED